MPKPNDRPRPGDTVIVDGCHRRYRPTLVRIEGNTAVVTSCATEHRWPLSKVRLAPPLPKTARERMADRPAYD